MLSDEGYVVTTATTDARRWRCCGWRAVPDAIVLDLMMPVMDGWEFRVEQRADPLLAGIPLMAMSADLSAKARAIAADAYVRKPIDFPEMLRLLRDVVGRAARHRLATADRMAALGTLASGIAHEINNPLTYVIANLQTLADRLPTSSDETIRDLAEVVADALEGAERIRRLVKRGADGVARPARRAARQQSRSATRCGRRSRSPRTRSSTGRASCARSSPTSTCAATTSASSSCSSTCC